MLELADHLANLTGYRDRDVLDATLVGALRDMLRPHRIAIYRTVGESPGQRWLSKACLCRDDLFANADPTWVDIESLPLLTAYPARCEALTTGWMVLSEGGVGHVSVFPLASDFEIVGVLEIETETSLDVTSQRIVGSILRLFSNLQGLLDYSERDSLTGLLNRKTFDESFLKLSPLLRSADAVAADGRRKAGLGSRCWVGMMDVDHFKVVNDKFGHLIGDEALILLSRLMRSSFRYHDTLYRFGGEEFIVLMRCNDESDVAKVFDRLRCSTEAYEFPQVGCVTISAAFTELKAGDSPSAALERADQGVYYAKSHGRSQVCNYAQLVARGELVGADKVGGIELF